jgi:hypothetical protein
MDYLARQKLSRDYITLFYEEVRIMEAKKIAYIIACMYGFHKVSKGIGYLSCMKDVAEQHSDILPDGKLTLRGGKKNKFSISVSKPEAEESQ